MTLSNVNNRQDVNTKEPHWEDQAAPSVVKDDEARAGKAKPADTVKPSQDAPSSNWPYRG